jgi:transposase
MSSSGKYIGDPTEGITHSNDLPIPKVQHRSRIRNKSRCPHCKYLARQHGIRQRSLHHLGDPHSGRPIEITLHYSIHYCCKCKTFFNVDMTALAPVKSDYTNAVIELAVRLVVDDGLPYRNASWHLWRDPRVFVPFATIQN